MAGHPGLRFFSFLFLLLLLLLLLFFSLSCCASLRYVLVWSSDVPGLHVVDRSKYTRHPRS